MADIQEERKKKYEEEKKEREEEEKARETKEKNVYFITKIIGAINPDLYCDERAKSEVKALLKKGDFWKAVDKVKPKSGQEFTISYNSSTESLEPVYFWILDFLGGESKVDKLVDNFQSSPGSGHFSELMGKATRMQEESMKVMQTIGVLIKSVINIVYDLRQFEIRLKDYKAANDEKDKNKAEAGLIALKQTWLDNVDIKRGNTSIKGMAFSQASFATLIDAFMFAKSIDEVKDKLDLNDRVKRILEQRLFEFNNWRELSEKELYKRYRMEKFYLKSQVDSIKLYSRWAKPYLKAAEELRMSTNTSSALVKAFNTILLNLTLLKKEDVDVVQEMLDKNLPKGFDNLVNKGKVRDYKACVLVDFTFRGIPQRVEQHYGFGGKTDVTFKAYALNQEEIDKLKEKLEESDFKEAMNLVQGATQDSLAEIQEDINYFLKDVEEREDIEDEEEKSKSENVNPFSALIGKGTFWGKESKKDAKSKDKDKKKDIKPDSYAEKVIRNLAELNAKKICFTVYDTYKKAHGMAAVPFGDQFNVTDIKINTVTDVFKKKF